MINSIPNRHFRFTRSEMTIREKISQLNGFYIFLITVICSIGFMTLYSAGNGSWSPWAIRQIARFALGMAILLTVAIIDIRSWMRWAYGFYIIALILLIFVQLHGSIGMGAQRWINIGFIQLQPSEIMKVGLILALSRYFHSRSYEDIGYPYHLIIPIIMILLPTILVLKQPDLGTALILLLSSGAIFFLAGVRLWKFGILLTLIIGTIPIAWRFMRDYQKLRILTFLNPESDPQGSGYHILQSKIALGSGGLTGKGFLAGTQGHLNFLPEKHTDFIFTMLAEEWGLVGGGVLLGLYGLLIYMGYSLSLRARNQFARLVGLGVTTMFFFYVFINIAMVMGLLPVVGVPLPLISYGGTAMLSLLFSFGLVLSADIHRDVLMGRWGGDE